MLAPLAGVPCVPVRPVQCLSLSVIASQRVVRREEGFQLVENIDDVNGNTTRAVKRSRKARHVGTAAGFVGFSNMNVYASVQINPAAQNQLRSKAIYTLSGLLKYNAAAITQFEAASAPVHPNSHASMVADPTSVDTATETLRALRAHGLLPVLVRELTEPTPYGPDGDEGDECDADLEEKLIRLLHTYVSAHNGTFDGPEKNSLRTFFDAKRVTPGEGELGLGADELRGLRNALA
ncbi:hypothetical protein DFH94DRAFT_686880 [Russula ochroleuca]|uniref:Uncharacterized protein n=1 Tax=Russula ochroleuca TaxID=152965 RepID=A0A9P5JUT5_9AGAM|nr:hypothetical protein DFH94DRAFT_686880 [Russula ochroleuca]